MGKRIEIKGHFYRMRRGELVLIPDEWVGETLHPQTKRKRRSKRSATEKRNTVGHTLRCGTWPDMKYLNRFNVS